MASKMIIVPALATAIGCGPSLTNQERLERISNYYTGLEMNNLKWQGLELEDRINDEVSANIWTTMESRIAMENKEQIIKLVRDLFTEQSAYFNSFCPHSVREIEIVIDNIGDDFGSVPSYTRIIVLDEENLELLLNHPDNMMKSIVLIHEYAHIQRYWLDQDEPRMYSELSSILVESLNSIRVHGFDSYKISYRINFDNSNFNPNELLGDQAGYYAIRTLVRQFMIDIFEGNIEYEENIDPLRKLEQFTGLYFSEEANGSEGFDIAAENAGLIYDGRALRLSDIRRRAFENETP